MASFSSSDDDNEPTTVSRVVFPTAYAPVRTPEPYRVGSESVLTGYDDDDDYATTPPTFPGGDPELLDSGVRNVTAKAPPTSVRSDSSESTSSMPPEPMPYSKIERRRANISPPTFRRMVRITPRTPFDWYNPYTAHTPIRQILCNTLGDVRDESSTRIEWRERVKATGEENEAMDRITSMFGLESFKRHCFNEYKRIMAIPLEDRSAPLHRDRLGIVLQGYQGIGERIASRRYSELLISLGVLRNNDRKWSAWGSRGETEFPDTEHALNRFLERLETDDTHSYLIELPLPPSDKWPTLLRQLVKMVFDRGLASPIIIATVSCTSPPIDTTISNFTILTLDPLHDQEIEHGLEFLLWTGSQQVVAKDKRGALLQTLLDGVLRRREDRKTWREWETLEKCANIVREHIKSQSFKLVVSGDIDYERDRDVQKSIGCFDDTPDTVAARCELYRKFRQMQGLENVKADLETVIQSFTARLRQSVFNDDQSGSIYPEMFHRFISGPPGTGRRMVAMLYAEVFCALGLLKSGKMIHRKISDFVRHDLSPYRLRDWMSNRYYGAILVEDDGGVARYAAPTHYSIRTPLEDKDQTQQLVIRARYFVSQLIISELEKFGAKEKRPIVIIVSLGESHQSSLPDFWQDITGKDRVLVSEYTSQQLLDILKALLYEVFGLRLDEECRALKTKLIRWLEFTRERPGFEGVHTLKQLSTVAATAHRLRTASHPQPDPTLTEADFGDNISIPGVVADAKWSEGIIGNADILAQLEHINKSVSAMRRQRLRNIERIFPRVFLFCGSTGTGKTTLARTALAKLYHQLGFIGTLDIVEYTMSEFRDRHYSDLDMLLLRERCRERLSEIMYSATGKVLLIQNLEPKTSKDVELLAITREVILSCIREFMAPPHGEYMNKLVVVWEERSVKQVPPHDIFDGSDKDNFFKRFDFSPIDSDSTVVELFREHMASVNLSVEEVSLSDSSADSEADNGGIPTRILRSGDSRNRWDLISLANEIIQDAYIATGPVKILVGEADNRPRALIVRQKEESDASVKKIEF